MCEEDGSLLSLGGRYCCRNLYVPFWTCVAVVLTLLALLALPLLMILALSQLSSFLSSSRSTLRYTAPLFLPQL